MNKKKYIKRLESNLSKIDKLVSQIHSDTVEYVNERDKDKEHPQTIYFDISQESNSKIEGIFERFAQVYDKLRCNSTFSHQKGYKRSFVYKIRKVLGFTYP